MRDMDGSRERKLPAVGCLRKEMGGSVLAGALKNTAPLLLWISEMDAATFAKSPYCERFGSVIQ